MKNENKSQQKDSIKKWKLLGKKSHENYLFNIISDLINNKEYTKKTKATDFELQFITNSDISSKDELKYSLKIKYISFKEERDKYKNINKYKDYFPNIEIKDEYYQKKNFFDNIIIELIPFIHKDMYLNLSIFPFYYYDNNKKSIKKYLFTSKLEDNKFILCIYLSELNELNTNTLKNLNSLEIIYKYFKNIYIIIEVKEKEEIVKIINKIKTKNLENEKINYIFSLLKDNDDKNEIYNIFMDKNNIFYPEYYFILDSNNRVIKINKKLNSVFSTINNFIDKIEKCKTEETNYKEQLLIKKENKKKENSHLLKDLINFILNMKNLNYLFDFEFSISFNAILNEECSDIFLKRINSIKINGKLRTKEKQYLENLLNLIKNKNKKKDIEYKFEELETIDIEIDFTDMKCFKCSKLIPEDEHLFYCYICKTKYCYDCVNEQLKKEGKEKYIDQKHNLLFFKTRNKNNFKCLDKPRFGNNKFAENFDKFKFSESHSAICNGCREGFPHMARYVCMHCKPGIYLSDGYIDYCQKCIEIMCKDENKKREREARANKDYFCETNFFTENFIIPTRHLHDEHIYLLLPLQYEGVSHPYKNY